SPRQTVTEMETGMDIATEMAMAMAMETGTVTGTKAPDTVRQENSGVRSAPSFFVVPGATVKRVLDDHKQEVFDAVETAYRLHGSGQSVNPDSYFLRYPDKPSSRIIALPAHLGGAIQKSGIKWISSFPENRVSNLARASAVLILNDATTGYPLACIEASLISATRTAASAALAAEHISPNPFEGSLGVIGTGVIARTAIEWLFFRNWKFHKISLYDV